MSTPSQPVQKQVVGTTDAPDKYSTDQLEKLANSSKEKDFANKVIAWTKSNYQQCKTARQFVERQWYINMAFYCSRQNVSMVPFNNGSSPTMGIRLYTPQVPAHKSRPVINRIRPIVRKELAKLTAQKPSATVVPSTSEDRDLSAAQAGEQIWDSIYRDKKLKPTFRTTVFWSIVTGNGFMKEYWDPTAKSADDTPGDFCFENVTPFNLFFPDLLADDIECQPYVIHVQTRTPSWIKLNFKLDVPPDAMQAADILNDTFLNLIGATAPKKDTVLVYEVWVKPGHVEFMPDGGMFTIIGSNMVQFVKGNPYLHKQYPFIHLPYMPTGRFYGDSVVNDLIPVQREYNRTRGQVIENKNTMGSIKLIAAEGSIDPSKVNTAPGQAILYKLGFPAPTIAAPVPLPAYIPQEIDRLLLEFNDISGQHDVSKGQAPPGVTAATAISFLQEQDETMLASVFQAIEEAYEKIAFQALCHVKQYWTLPRMVKVVGLDGQFNVLAFRGSDLRDNTDIRIEAGSALPTSKAAKQALLMDLMSQGFVPPEKGLELMDIGGVQRLYDQLRVDNSQASRENMKMSAVTDDQLAQYQMISSMPTMPGSDPLGLMQGMMQTQTPPAPNMETGMSPGMPDPNNMPADISPDMASQMSMQAQPVSQPPLIVPVNSYDNHQIHIDVHNNYRKSQQFEGLSPTQKKLFEDHVNQHLVSMGLQPGSTPQAQQAQMQMQQSLGPGQDSDNLNSAAPPGAPPGPGASMDSNNTPPGPSMPMGGVPNG